MKKLVVLVCLAATVSMTAGIAMADSIKGKLGVTGRIGILNPADNTADNTPGYYTNKTDNGFVAGAGIIYGYDNNIAGEIELTRAEFGSETGDFGVTSVSFGGQYRFMLQQRRLVPYVGAGVDVFVSDYEEYHGYQSDVETVIGFHVSGGVDFFLQKNLALTGEVKLVAAPDANITDSQTGAGAGHFDPSGVSTTVGLRYFFN